MRDFIDIVEQLNEGRFKNFAISAALGAATATGAMHGVKAHAEAEPQIPSYYVYDDEAAELGLSSIDEVDPYLDAAETADTPSMKTQRKVAKGDRSAVAAQAPNEAVQLLALTMWGDARQDGPEAMRAVGHVVMNRIRSARHFGRNIKEVVWKRKAFSCWNPSDPNRAAMKSIKSLPSDSLDKIRYKQAVKIARDIIGHADSDPTSGALFYHTKSISPGWSLGAKPVVKLDNHVFYRVDGKAPKKA